MWGHATTSVTSLLSSARPPSPPQIAFQGNGSANHQTSRWLASSELPSLPPQPLAAQTPLQHSGARRDHTSLSSNRPNCTARRGLADGPQQVGQTLLQSQDPSRSLGMQGQPLCASSSSSPRSPLLWSNVMIFTLPGASGKSEACGAVRPQVLFEIFQRQIPVAGGTGTFSNSQFNNARSNSELRPTAPPAPRSGGDSTTARPLGFLSTPFPFQLPHPPETDCHGHGPTDTQGVLCP